MSGAMLSPNASGVWQKSCVPLGHSLLHAVVNAV